MNQGVWSDLRSAWLILSFTALAALAYWYVKGRPVVLAELPQSSQQSQQSQASPRSPGSPGSQDGAMRMQCLSYAPFRKPGESPFNVGTRVSPERIETDLKLLTSVTECVRIYSVQQGLEVVPEVARRLGLKVMLGVWLGRNRAENESEMKLGIALARKHADVVTSMIIGNEVLLRRELPAQAIGAYIDEARANVSVPVTYADVWEFWVRNPELAKKVSFATIHILPYWEDEPVAIEQAVPHVLNIVRHVQEVMPGVRLVIGETGWPSQGRARHGAVPSLVNQARFAREFAIEAPKLGVPYNFIEAFDQPWKRRLEGAMGGGWGVLDSNGVQKFAIRGPVIEDAAWLRGWWAAAAAALACALVSALVSAFGLRLIAGEVRTGLPKLALWTLAGAAAGAVAAAQWTYLWVWNRDFTEWSVTLLYSLLAFALWFVAVGLRLQGSSGLSTESRWLRVFAGLRLALLFGAAVLLTLLVFDARYRGFPWPLYCLPAVAFLLLARERFAYWRDGLEERFLAGLIVLFGILVVIHERPDNWHSSGFVLLLVAMAALAVRGRFLVGAAQNH